MGDIQAKVAKARRRMLAHNFVQTLGWTLLAGLIIAAIGIAFPKLYPLSVVQTPASALNWNIAWLTAGIAGGLLTAGIWSWVRRPTTMQAAIEVDRRYDLQERLSSLLSYRGADESANWKEALEQDASRAVSKIDVKERFQFGFAWRQLSALLPALLIAAIWTLVANAQAKPDESANQLSAAATEEIERINKELEQRLLEEISKAEDLELEEAEEALRRVADSLRSDGKPDRDAKEDALVRMNDAKQELDQRAKEIGDADAMRRQLAQLKTPTEGPANEFQQAMAEGNLEEAQEELQSIIDQLNDAKLTPEEQSRLAEQLAEMKQQLEENTSEERRQQQELQDQIQQAKLEGDPQKAGNLQQQLDDLERSNPQLQQLDNIASDLEQAGEAISQSQQEGNSESLAEAANSLQKASDQLGKAQGDAQELQTLEGIQQQIAKSKQQINDAAQQGQPGESSSSPNDSNSQQLAQNSGEQNAPESSQQSSGESGQQGEPQSGQSQAGESQSGQQGSSQNGGQPADTGGQSAQSGQSGSSPGNAQSQSGANSGQNSSSQQAGGGTQAGTGAHKPLGGESQIDQSVKSTDERVDTGEDGPGLITGTVKGSNPAGKSRIEIIQEVSRSLQTESDPLQEQTLPRRQQDQAREYFRKFKQSQSTSKSSKSQ